MALELKNPIFYSLLFINTDIKKENQGDAFNVNLYSD